MGASGRRLLDRLLDAAFGHPRGLLGRLGGALMVSANRATEREAVRLTEITGADLVVVVGCGPGVGLLAAGENAGLAVGIDPSAEMRSVARRRCAPLIRAGTVEVRDGTAEDTGFPDQSVDAVTAVNNVQLWPNRAAALAELRRILRPDGRVLLSAHERWLPGGVVGLLDDVRDAGFIEVQCWTWQPPHRWSFPAAQLRARRPGG